MKYCPSLAVVFLAALGAGCASVPPLPEAFAEPVPGVERSDVFHERWQRYVSWVEQFDLQPECHPRLFEPDDGVPYRGTVVLLHGFSACTQQYPELAGLLSAKGFRSIVPVLPGHGRPYPDIRGDDPSALPNARNWRDIYFSFADQINGVMEYADGDRVVAGLSGGGAVGLGLNFLARDLYDRNLTIAPFLAISGGRFVNGVAQTFGSIPMLDLLPVAPFGIKNSCVAKREKGRAGYCSYQLRHVAGMRGLGHAVRVALRDDPLDVRLQMVGVEKDSAVGNYRIHELLEFQSEASDTTACFLPEGIPHSMFSRADNPDTDMWWLDSFFDGVVNFIVDGEPFPTDGTSEAEAPWPLCRVERQSQV